MSCGVATQSLQNYAAQVNQFYNTEYWTVIPNQRCPAYDQYGRYFDPNIVQNCRIQTLTYLNQWYGQQSAYVNNWYASIVRACSTQNTTSYPGSGQTIGSREAPPINVSKIENIEVADNENKVVKISIPDTPEGFKARAYK